MIDDPTKYLVENEKEVRYFPDDPVLSFEDSILYGCHLDLSYKELEEFCSNNEYQNLMIFNNLFTLKYIGKFGNANVHFIKDWLELSKDNVQSGAAFSSSECTFPSAAQVRIFYSKLGSTENP